MTRLIAIDIDGTLRRDDGTISEYSKEVLRASKDEIVLATARPRYHALSVALELNCRYFICLSGSEVYDIKNNMPIYESFLPDGEVDRIIEYATLNDVRIILNDQNNEYATKFIRNNNQILLTKKLINVKNCMVIDSNKEKVKAFYDYMNDANIIVSGLDEEEAYFVIVPADANKGVAVKKLATYLNLKEILSFGNDNNDIPLFKVSTKSFAVFNSTKELIDEADEVIESNNNDGVANIIKNLY